MLVSDKKIICDESGNNCVIINARTAREVERFEAKSVKDFDQQKYDEKTSSAYIQCDAPVPILGHACDNLNTSTGLMRLIITITAFPLIGWVLFMDIFGDWIVIVTQFLAEGLDGVPVLGTIFSLIEAPELDDIFDMASLAIMFFYIGPVAMVGIPEFAEGILELFPFWTAMLIVWFIFIRPARVRFLRQQRLEEMEQRKAIEEAQARAT